MRLDESRLIDEVLTSDEPCLGAAFCSYTFDPTYFEEHVLRAILRLTGDPGEDPTLYHQEARAALQETPVACVVDASVRQPGRRLPYDVHLVRSRTFHPKMIMLVYDQEARLAIGSGNLTKAGLEGNAELFFVRRLRFDEPADVALLREVDSFFGECQALSATDGSQLALVRSTLSNRLLGSPDLPVGAARDAELVTSFGGSLLNKLNEAIHPNAKIVRVGVLAPFFEQDDLSVASLEDGMSSLLAELVGLRPSPDLILELGLPWDDAPVVAPASSTVSLEDGLGRLWAWRERNDGESRGAERISYLTPMSLTPKRVEALCAAGEERRFERASCEAAIAEARLWPVSRPVVYAPKTIVQRIANEHHLRIWLHPSSELAPAGGVRRRPLHAKAVLVTTVHRGKMHTYALIGSANASRAALSRGVSQGGNIEACVICRFDGEVAIRDLLPTLVSYSLDGVDLLEREPPKANVDLSAWIEEVVYDAAQRLLEVRWRASGPASLGAWELRYLDHRFAEGTSAPSTHTLIEGFELGLASAEVTLVANGGEWQIPIRVLDLAALPINEHLTGLGLLELLALLGRRVGSERLATLRAQRGTDGAFSLLRAVFGEGFGATDVFKAWWGAVEDLKLAATIASFRHRLIGPTGVLTAWKHLQSEPDEELSRDEVWIYGCELLRELLALELAPGPDAATKAAMLLEVTETLTGELADMSPQVDAYPWLVQVRKFYGIGGRRVGA